ncbi:MAG: hypothetical protein FJX71_04515 [Alphaproteobacteria bacterium]|nr:hypothetical protein [Alphaproteobacteria bacterium]
MLNLNYVNKIINYKCLLRSIALLLFSGVISSEGMAMEQGIKRSFDEILDEKDKSKQISVSKRVRYESDKKSFEQSMDFEEDQVTGKDEMLSEEPVTKQWFQDDDPMSPSVLDLFPPDFGSEGTVGSDLVSTNLIYLLSSSDFYRMQQFMFTTNLLDPEPIDPEPSLFDIPDEVFHSGIFSTFDLYDLGRFEMVSKSCMRLCSDSVWQRVGHVIQEDYGPDVVLTKELIKGHLMRGMLLTMPNEQATEKVIELSQGQSPLLPNLLSTRPPFFAKFYNCIKPINRGILESSFDSFFKETFKEDFYKAYASKFMILMQPDIIKERLWMLMFFQRGVVKGISPRSTPLKERFNLQHFKVLNDFLIERGDKGATNEKIKDLCIGSNGYPRDKSKARELNEQLVSMGYKSALLRKFLILLNGNDYDACDFYNRNPRAARDLNDQLVAMRDRTAIDRKFEGLIKGKHGYEQNLQVAKVFNEQLVAEGNYDAINKKYYELFHGMDCYEQDRQAAKELNEQLVAIGDKKAIERKCEGLFFGIWNYEKNPQAAKDLIKEYGLQGHWKTYGGPEYLLSDYPVQEVRDFNEELVAVGDMVAVDRKYRGLFHGLWGYEVNPQAARDFNEEYVRQGNAEAINRWLERITKNIDGSFERISQYFVYEAWQTNVKQIGQQILQYVCGIEMKYSDRNSLYKELTLFVEDYAARDIRLAHYIKALGMLKGIWGFNQDQAEAIKYMRRHYLAL